ncbi:MAG TPA: vWA domain-containing protein [Ktedonobacterales bacterium]|jgi:hypothetical protein
MQERVYIQPATTLTPALIIYLVDASDSMNQMCSDRSKMEVVNKALRLSLRDLWRRSMRDGMPQRRYKIAIFAYSTKVVDVLGGMVDLPELLQYGVPQWSADGVTDMAAAFATVEAFLEKRLAEFQRCPAPLVCHLTDAVFTTTDPSPAISRIQGMRVEDGPVLMEHVYVAERMLRKPIRDWYQWQGVRRASELADKYARFLLGLSSRLPEPYRHNINGYGYHLQPGAMMFFPGIQHDLIRLAFVASIATQIK